MGTYSRLLQREQTSPSSPDSGKSDLTESLSENSDADASMYARKHTSMNANNHAPVLANIHSLLQAKATNGFAFRYPPELLEMLEDMLYQVRKQHNAKLTKNSVAVAALVFILSDYEAHGKESVLYQMLVASTN